MTKYRKITVILLVTSSSSRMRVIYRNWSATKQRPHPQSVAEISRHSVLSGTGFYNVRHRLGLATRTQISVCKSPFPSAGTAVSLLLVTDTISLYRKNWYLQCRYDTDTDISMSAIYRWYFWYIDPFLVCVLLLHCTSELFCCRWLIIRCWKKITQSYVAN